MAQASEAAVSALAAKLSARSAGTEEPEKPQDAAAPRKARGNRQVGPVEPPAPGPGDSLVDIPDELAAQIAETLGPDAVVGQKPRKAKGKPQAEAKAEEPEPEPVAAEAAEDEPTEVEAAPEGEEGEEPAPIESLADIAEGLELDEAQLLDMLHIDVEGERKPLSAVLKEHREAALAQNLLPQVEARAQEHIRALERTETEAAQRFQKLDQLLESLVASIEMDGLNPAEWRQLKQDDPAAYIARRDQYDQRVARVRASVAARDAENQRLQQVQQQQFTRWQAGERTKLLADPELGLNDPQKAQALSQSIGAYLTRMGFLDHEVGNLFYDHRVAKTIWKADQYDKLKAEAARKGRPAGEIKRKVATPRGENASAETSRTKRFEALRGRLKSTAQSGSRAGNVDALAGVLLEKGRLN